MGMILETKLWILVATTILYCALAAHGQTTGALTTDEPTTMTPAPTTYRPTTVTPAPTTAETPTTVPPTVLVEGSFAIESEFTVALTDSTSADYTTLEGHVTTGLANFCSHNAITSITECTTTVDSFTGINDDTFIQVNFTMYMPEGTDADAVRLQLITFVENEGSALLSPAMYNIWASSICLIGVCNTYCTPVDVCGNFGTCSDLATTYECTCDNTHIGSRCLTEVTIVPISFLLDAVFDNALSDDTSQAAIDLIAAILTGVRVSIPGLHDFQNVDFSSGSISFSANMRIETPFTDADIQTAQADLVSRAEQGMSGIVAGYIVIARTFTTGTYTQLYCDPNPCEAGGTCTEQNFGFSCACTANRFGDTCESQTDFCAGTPCENGATCTSGLSDYTCACADGYTGEDCETDIDYCDSTPCENGGTCSELQSTFECECALGFSGTTCDTVDRLMPYGPSAFDTQPQMFTSTATSGTYVTSRLAVPDFQIASSTFMNFYISANGYVVFGTPFYGATPGPWSSAVGSRSSDFAIFAPHWTSCAYDRSNTPIYYHVYQLPGVTAPAYATVKEIMDLAREKYESTGRAGFDPTVLLVVTWVDTIPAEQYDSNLDSPNTFQFVLLANPTARQTAILFLYKSIGWRDRGFIRDALIGYYCLSGDTIKSEEHAYSSLIQSGLAKPSAFNLDELALYSATNALLGIYPIEVTVAAVITNDIRCQNWYNKEITAVPPTFWTFIQTLFWTAPSGPVEYFQRGWFPSCPCSLFMLFFRGVSSRWWFQSWTSRRICYISRSSFFGSKQCCYDTTFSFWFAPLILNNRNAGTLKVFHPFFTPGTYAVYDEEPYEWCCGATDATKCDLYQELRPVERRCTFIRPWLFCGFGDPHYRTMDVQAYTFNGLGEYIMMDTNITETVTENGVRNPLDPKKVTIHVRHIQALDTDGQPQRATIFGAYAIRVTDSVPVYVGMNAGRTAFDFRLSGESTFDYSDWFINADVNDTLPDAAAIAGVVTTKVAENQLSLFYDGALTFEVTIEQGQLGHQVSVESGIYESKTSGLLGNFNGDATDDLIPRGSTVALPANSTDEVIYNDFGQTWKLSNDDDNLFTQFYTGDENYELFNENSDYEPAFFEDILAEEEAIAAQDPARQTELTNARTTCSGNDECLFDWLLTRNQDAASISADTVSESEDVNNNLNNAIPEITAPEYIVAEFNTQVDINVTVTDENADDTVILTYSGLDGFGTSGYDEGTDELTWTPNYNPTDAGDTPSIRLTAEDNNGGISPAVTVKIRYCYCLNGGSCPDNRSLQTGYGLGDNFLLLECECETGWSGDNCSSELDGCLDNPCDYSDCTDLDPTQEAAQRRAFTCGPCQTGYTKVDENDAGSNCVDLDECAANNGQGDCVCPATCVNNRGSFTCTCPAGYRLSDTGLRCLNIDECAEQTSGCDQICTDNIPGFTCSCRTGYILQPDERTCLIDSIDNRLADACSNYTCSQICGLNQTVMISRQCFCNEGYTLGDDEETCENIDECAEGTDMCHENSTCIDSDGSYSCECHTGFTLADDERTCTPCTTGFWGDECNNTCNCRETSTPCDIVTGCTACSDGYENTGNCDIDIDECTTTSPCGANTAECVNLPGTFQCPCDPGYEFDTQTTCQDINECATIPCMNGATCNNEVNAYSCDCVPGYTGTDCETEINECESSPCRNNGTCSNLVNAFLCDCTPEWEGTLCETTFIPRKTVHGFFIIQNINYTKSLSNQFSSDYWQLRANLSTVLIDQINESLNTTTSYVSTMVFKSGSVKTNFSISLFEGTDDDQIKAIFRNIQKAVQDGLFGVYDIDLESFILDNYKYEPEVPSPPKGTDTASSVVWFIVAGVAVALVILIGVIVLIVLRRRTHNDAPKRDRRQVGKQDLTDNTEGPYRNLPDMGIYNEITDKDLYMELDDSIPIPEPDYDNTFPYTTLCKNEQRM